MKKILSLMLSVMLLGVLALPAAAEEEGETVKFNTLASDVTTDDLDIWAQSITDAVAAYLTNGGTQTVDGEKMLSAVKTSLYEPDVSVYPNGYLDGIRSAADRSDLTRLFAHMERSAVVCAFGAVFSDADTVYAQASAFEAEAGNLLAQELYSNYYNGHVKRTDSELAAKVMEYYNANAKEIAKKLNAAVPSNKGMLKYYLSEENIGEALNAYLGTNAEDVNNMIGEIAKSSGNAQEKKELIKNALEVTLTAIIDRLLVPYTAEKMGLSTFIADFSADYAETLAVQYGNWLATAQSEGRLAIVTGVAGLVVGVVGTLIFTGKKKRVTALS